MTKDAAAPRRSAVGVNWYIEDYRVKVQLMRREIENNEGVRSAHGSATYLQAQFAF